MGYRMSLTNEHLAQYGISIQNAHTFIMDHLDNPSLIFNAAKLFGVTNEMLSEIVGVPTNTIKAFWESFGFASTELDGDLSLPTTYTTAKGIVWNIVAGTAGDDYFAHSSGNKIYLGMSGNDTFTSLLNASGAAWFVGGVGDDTYFPQPTNGITFIKDIGGGNDTLYDFEYIEGITGTGFSVVTIDNKYLMSAFYNTENELVATIGGDLTDTSDYIENYIAPGYEPMNQNTAVQLIKELDTWFGNISSGNGNLSGIYDTMADIVGIYEQYIDAGY